VKTGNLNKIDMSQRAFADPDRDLAIEVAS